jgi:integrase
MLKSKEPIERESVKNDTKKRGEVIMASGWIVRREGKKGVVYAIRYYGPDGHRYYRTVGKRKADAERILYQLLAQIDRGEYTELPNITFDEMACKYLESQKTRVREKTYLGYRGHLENRIIPYFSGRKIKTITPVEVEAFLTTMADEGVTSATVAKHLATMKMVLKRAVEWGYLIRSPAQYIKPPRVPRQEMDFLTPEEMAILIKATEEEHRYLIMCACLTGMRQGEILGLEWGDIDFDSSRIFVRRTCQKGRFYEPKTPYSRRAVVIPESLLVSFREHQMKQIVEGQVYDKDIVFPSQSGKPMDPHYVVCHILWPALARAGLRRVRFHDLRHSYAAALLSKGENPKFVQRQLGHSSIQITLDLYGHLLPETERDAAVRLEQALSSKVVG